jgi:YbgC/YbaW family acyl-CoA thioester hydrolase
VRGYELDSYRHVNHAVYLSYLEQARWDYLASCGLTLNKLDELKRWPVVVHLEINYLRPALMDDELTIFSRLSHLGRASLEIEHEIHCHGKPITRAKVKAAIIDEHGRAAAMPDQYRDLALHEK